MKQTKRSAARWFRWLPAFAWMCVIFALSSRTGEDLGSLMPFFQSIFPGMQSFDWGHFAAYFVLALLIDFAIGSAADRLPVKLLIVLICLLYGLTDEYHQSFVDGRMPDAKDLRNDAIGAALAVLALKVPFVRKRWRRIAP